MTGRQKRGCLVAAGLVVVAVANGCDDEANMARQPRIGTLQPSPVFIDGGSARPLVEGVVSTDGVWFTNTPVTALPPPPPLSVELLIRGREVFNISCLPCHGEAGYGDGMVVRRGYPEPPSYHTSRARSLSDDHMFRVITDGLGKMPAYVDQVPDDRDRWALVGYIRALQLSQHAGVDDVPESDRSKLIDDEAATPASRSPHRGDDAAVEEPP